MNKNICRSTVINPNSALIRKAGRIIVISVVLLCCNLFNTEAQITITKYVSASSDDAEQQGATGASPGAVNLISNDLELVNDIQSPSAGTQTTGIRFQGINIPQGAIITSAYITFTAVTPDPPMTNSEATSLNIKGQAADNALTFTTAINNISERILTSASVAWIPTAWAVGSKYNTPVIAGIVQEIVNRPGWVSGNSMSFIISGTGHRSAASWDDVTSGNEPKLVITYTTLHLSASVTNIICYGGSTGSINLTVTGGTPPYTFDWNYNGFGGYTDPEDISNSPAGTYVVKVIDNAGTTAETFATILQPGAALTLSTTVFNVTTPGGTNGEVDLTVSGGTLPYSYHWSNSAITEDISNIPGGIYSVTVTDANNCTATIADTVGTVSNPASATKYLYLSDTLKLDRVDPFATNDLTMNQTAIMGIGAGKSIYAFYGNSTTNFYNYSITGSSWSTKAAAPANVAAGGALTTDGTYIYAFEGGTNLFWRYNPSLNTWSALATTPAAVGTGGALAYAPGGTSGYIYALRGGNTTTFWRYDIAANSWTAMRITPGAVGAGGSLVYTGTAIYALRGNNKNNLYRYNIAANTWTTLANLAANVNPGGALTYDGTYLYALNGNNKNTFNRYDIVANTWLARATTPASINTGGSLTFDGTYIYAFRGGATTAYYRYNRTTNTWSSMAPTTVAVGAGGALVTFDDGLGGEASLTFTQSQALCNDMTIVAGQIKVEAYATVTAGTMPANPSISAQLKYGSNIIATLSNPTYNSSTGLLTWTTTLGTNVMVPSGNAITLTFTTTQSGVAYKIDYDSKTKPSKITFKTNNYISINSVKTYDAAYSGGSEVTTLYTNTNYYIRVNVTDPFGSSDINGVNLILTMPDNSEQTIILGPSSVVSTPSCGKIYEYNWSVPALPGNWNIQAVAKEGTEGVVYAAATNVTVYNSTGVVTKIKSLYFSADGTGNPDYDLDRIDPVSTSDATTALSEILGSYIGTITPGTTAVGNGTGSSITISNYSAGSGINRLMLVGVSWSPNDNETITSVTYGGTALTLVPSSGAVNSNRAAMAIYRLVNPAPGPANVVVTFNEAVQEGAVVGVTTFTNVDQTSPLGTAASAIGTSTTPAVTVASATGEVVFGVKDNRDPVTTTPVSGETIIWDLDGGARADATACYETAGATSTTISYTLSASKEWAIGAVPLRPGVITGATTVSFSQTPSLCTDLTIKAGHTITAKVYVNVTGGIMDNSSNVTATIKYGATTIATLSNGGYASGLLTLTGTTSSDVTIPAGQSIVVDVTNNQSALGFQIRYDSQTYPSKIDLPVTTYINISAFAAYDDAYPGGAVITGSTTPDSTVYLRATVSDPFGVSDITGLDVNIEGTTHAASVVNTVGCSRVYEYAWTPGTSGDYSISAVAKEGYEGIVFGYKTMNNFPVCGFTITGTISQEPNCYYPNIGQVHLEITGSDGPFTWTWSRVSPAGTGNGSGTLITGLSAGSYDVTVTSAGGCTSATSGIINDPEPPTVSSTILHASCIGNDGSVNIVVSGGSGSYSYFWEDGILTANRTGLESGNYVLHVTDQINGCVAIVPIDIQRENDISASGAVVQPSGGLSNGAINLTPVGGSGLYISFQWTGPSGFSASTEDINGLAAGVYTVMIADDGSCIGYVSLN